jgi:succinyldiaminopimelate transaminase
LVQRALKGAADAPGYPLTAGSGELRQAIVDWLARRFGATVPVEGVLPVIGTKELVAWLPTLLGAKRVGIPTLAYPTYDVGARYAGAVSVVTDAPAKVDLLWINSPSNPTGRVASPKQLRKSVSWAQTKKTDRVLASDECYADLYYGADFDGAAAPLSILSPEVCGDSHRGLLAVHSLSKRSNLAGYRAGFIAGDPMLIKPLLELRKHLGMIVPAPVQAAMIAALGDDKHVETQRRRYAKRRTSLLAALQSAGFTVEDTRAGLYLWATRDENCSKTVAWLAERGILVAPGSFYGADGKKHVRIALTATDERIAAAVARLA